MKAMSHLLLNQLMYKKIKISSNNTHYLWKKLIDEGLTSEQKIEKQKKFKKFLEKEFESSKNYKSELKWFEGAWSRFRPGLGKDKRGVSGVKKDKLIEIGKKISTIPKDFNVHKTILKKFLI